MAGCTYVEPYAGGAGAGMALLVSGQVNKVVVNDLDPAVATFWRTLVNDPEWMMQRVATVELSVAEWKRQRSIYAAGMSGDPGELGFATFYLNRTNRSGVMNGGPIGGHDQSGTYKIDARFNRDALVERIRTIGLYKDRIEVSSMDGIKVISKYAKRKNTFIYADPPYFDKAGSLYLNAFTSKDHAALAKVLNAAAKQPWLLTYDLHPQVDELYAGRRRRTFTLNYSAHRVVKATEVAILSDSVTDIADGWPSV